MKKNLNFSVNMLLIHVEYLVLMKSVFITWVSDLMQSQNLLYNELFMIQNMAKLSI